MERWRQVSLEVALVATSYLWLNFFAFSPATKAEAIRIRGNRCQRCGKTNVDLYAHHRVPHQFGGNDEIQNLALLCGTCHPIEDHRAEHKGIIFPGTPVSMIDADELVDPNRLDRFYKYKKRFLPSRKK